MYKALVFCFFLHVPQPQPVYVGWWHMTGHNYGAPEQKVAVVKPCHPAYTRKQEKFQKFCQKSGRYLDKYGGNKFCLSTGLLTKERCETVIQQNTRKKRVIWRLIED